MARVQAMVASGDAIFVLQADGSVFGFKSGSGGWAEIAPVPRTEAAGREEANEDWLQSLPEAE